MDSNSIIKKALALIQRYKYPFMILLVGICMMLIPIGNSQDESNIPDTTVSISPPSMEDRLADILRRVRGAGDVKVLLTTRIGEEVVFQTDTSVSNTQGNGSSISDTVIISDANRTQAGLVKQVNGPIYQGAIILCQGASDPSVRLAITEAVSKATGLGSDRISVLEMK